MEFVQISDVELCSAGMEWPSAGGPVTLTLEHIADAAAAWEDPLIVPARLKIGHTDPRFADLDDPGHDPFYDGEPAFGSIHNHRLVNDGATLVGDYVYVPDWLAEMLPSCYPNRSIEGAYTIADGPGGKLEARWDVETQGGKKYSFVLTACALLGVQRPAVQDLEDLRLFMTEGDGVVVAGAPPAGGVALGGSMENVSGAVSLEADVDKVLDVFYSEFCVEDNDRYWWWARSVRVDPNVIIADDDEGSLWRVPIKTDGDQNVTFGEPERVLQTFTPAPEAAATLTAASTAKPKAGRTVAAFTAREQTPAASRKRPVAAMEVEKSDSCPDSMPWAVMDGSTKMSCHATKSEAEERMREMEGNMRAKGGVNGSATNSAMQLSDEQRTRLCTRLDLAEDASDEQIDEALAQEVTPGTPETGTEGSTETTEETPAEEGNGETEETETPAEPDETTTPVDSTVLSQLQADAAAGREARKQQVAEHRESVLKAALSDGKITPASKSAWNTKLEAAPEATEAELSALPKGLVPVEEKGHGGSSPSDPVEVSAEQFGAMFPGYGKVAA